RAPDGGLDVDVGLSEGIGTLRDVRRLGRLLARKGFARDRRARRTRALYDGVDRRGRHDGRPRVRYVEDAAGCHTEASWARRLEGALRFLLEGGKATAAIAENAEADGQPAPRSDRCRTSRRP